MLADMLVALVNGDPKKTEILADITLKHKAGKLWHVRERRCLVSLGLAGMVGRDVVRPGTVWFGRHGWLRLGKACYVVAWFGRRVMSRLV